MARRLGVHCLIRMSAKSLSMIWLGVKDLGIIGLGLGIAVKTFFSKGDPRM